VAVSKPTRPFQFFGRQILDRSVRLYDSRNRVQNHVFSLQFNEAFFQWTRWQGTLGMRVDQQR
jgi:hypothetical protein